ncbi:MAG: hypothetical protein GY720_01015 [bacterium]|nr:hypothetical protein [bacterium]
MEGTSDRRWSRWISAISLLAFAGVLMFFVAPARGDNPYDISIVPVTDPGNALDFVELDGSTYETAETALIAAVNSATLPLDVAGLPDPFTFSGELDLDPATASLTVTTDPTLTGADLFGSGSPLAGDDIELLLLADWDETDSGDMAPKLALVVKVAAGTSLSSLNPSFAAVEGAVPELTDMMIAFSPSAVELIPTDLPVVAADFLGSDNLELAPVANLFSEVDLDSHAAMAAAAEFLGSADSSLPVSGQLANTAQLLFDPGTADPADLESLHITVEFGGFLNAPSWIVGRDASFTVGIDAGVSFISLQDSIPTDFGGVTNTFKRSVDLNTAKEFNATVAVDGQFNLPFDLDWLILSDVGLSLEYDGSEFKGEVKATADVPLVDPADDPVIKIAVETDGTKVGGSVSVSGELTLTNVVNWFTTTGGFTGSGFADVFDEVSLTDIVYAYETDGTGLSLALFASTEIGQLDANMLVGFEKKTGEDASLLVGASLTEDDPDCDDCIRLGTALSDLDGTLAGDLQLPAIDLVVIQGKDPNTEGKVELDPEEFGDASKTFFERIYDDLPEKIELELGLNLSAKLPLDPLGDEVRNALGYEAGAKVVLKGTLGVTLGAFDADSDTELKSLGLEAELPEISGPEGLPDWLQFPLAPTSLKFEIGYDVEKTTFTFKAETKMNTDLFGGSRDIVITADFSSGPDTTKVTLTADMGAWNQPFGIEWLDLTEVDLMIAFETAQGSSTLSASLHAAFSIGGKRFEIDLEGELGDDPSATLTARSLDPISLGDLMRAVLSTATYDKIEPGIPNNIEDAAIDSTTIVVAVDGTKVSFSAAADFSFKLFDDPGESPIAFGLLLRLDTDGALTVGLKPNDGLSLSQLVPGDLPADIQLVGPDASFGIVVTTDAISSVASDDLDEPARTFFSPLYGEDPLSPGPFTVDLPEGLSLLGNVTLPDVIGTFMNEALGLKPGVQLSGTLPIFGTDSIELSLALEADPAKLPQWIHSASLAVVLRGDIADPALEFGLEGSLAVKFKAGMPPEIADALALAGVDVIVAEPVGAGGSCANGSTPLPIEEPAPGEDPTVSGATLVTNYYCFDILEFQVDATLSITAVPAKVAVDLGGQITSLAGPWYPFGLEWLGVSTLRVEIGLSVEAGPPPGIAVSFGFLGDVVIGPPGPSQKDLLFAAKVGAKVIPNPPFIIPEFEGIRMETMRGLELQDIVEIANGVMEAAAIANDVDPPPPIDIDGIVPNIAVRNLEFALSPDGVESLCIPKGLVISGDFYIDAPPAPPIAYTLCDGGQPKPPPEDEQCLHNSGCLASINMSLGTDGVFALAQLGAFDIGPLKWGGAELDIAVSAADTHLRIAGDATVEVAGETVASGELAVDLRPLTFDFYGRVEIFDFSALVDGSASLDVFNDSDPGLSLHVLLAASDAETGEPNFNSLVSTVATPVLSVVRTSVLVVDGMVEDIATLDAAVVVRNLPLRLRQAGIDVPQWLDDLVAAIDPVLSALPTSFANDVMNVVLNGVTVEFPGLEIGYSQICYVGPSGIDRYLLGFVWRGTCYKALWDLRPGYWAQTCLGIESGGKCYALLLPPITITIPGICNTVFPEASFPDLRNDEGKCEFSRMLNSVVFPLFDEAIRLVFPDAPSIQELRTELREQLLNAETMFEFGCFEFNLELTPENQSFDVGLEAVVYDAELAFFVGWDFQVPPIENLDNLLQGIFGAFTGDPPDVCSGLNTEVFESTGGGGFEDPDDPAQVGGTFANTTVDEGATATFNGTFNRPTVEARSVEVDWGDGTVASIAVAAEAEGFSATHVYVDDDPTVTSTDQKTVVISDALSPTTSLTRSVEVRNVTPVLGPLVFSADPVDENGSTTLSGTFADPGTQDSHSVEITWGDGTTDTLSLAVGERSFSAIHLYSDDEPSGTSSDVMPVRAIVVDDDGGIGEGSTSLTVDNVAATDLNLVPLEDPETGADTVFEGTLVQYLASFVDVGGQDNHVVTVDWGDGTSPDQVPLGDGERTFAVAHTYVEDDPTATPQDVYTVTVTVEDDDLGFATESFTITVVNVAPTFAVGATGNGVVLQGTPESSDDVIDEDGIIELSGFFLDPGVLDVHVIDVDWGDGDTSTITLPVGDQLFELSHRYLDDDPTATPQDSYTIAVTVTDDDTGTDSTTITHIVRDVAPVVSVDVPTQETQYSDPMVPVTIAATDVERDVLTTQVWWSAVSVDGPVVESGGLPSWLTFSGDGNCTIPSADNRRECLWLLEPVVNPASGLHSDAAPGTYTVRVRVTDDDTLYTDMTIDVVILPEDAVPFYVGPTYAATVAAHDGSTGVALRANVRDITTAADPGDPLWDPLPGDIRRADVTFYDMATDADLCSAEVDLVFAGDTNIGTAECSYVFEIGSANTVPFNIGVRVGHWYTNELAPEQAVLVVAKPLDAFMTGGGYIVLDDPAGVYAGDVGSKFKYGFNVKFHVKKKKVDLKGQATLRFWHDGRKYRVKVSGFESMGLAAPGEDPDRLGQFEARATLIDVTNRRNKVVVGENLKLQMRLVDNGNGAGRDLIQFRLFENKDVREQILLFASSWDGDQTVLQPTGGGNVRIHRSGHRPR